MLCFREIFGGIVVNADIQQGLCGREQAQPTRIGDGCPADIGLIAVFLGPDICLELTLNRAAVNAPLDAFAAVRVAFVGAESVPGKAVEGASMGRGTGRGAPGTK